MVTYSKAGKGKKFVLTEFGFELSRIRAKYEADCEQKHAYEHTVPTAWLEKGYVKEVEING